MYRILAAIFAVFFLFMTIPVSAATTGLVRGTVTYNGAPQNAAAVTLTGEGVSLTTKTNASGNYVFSQVPFGRYSLRVSSGTLAPSTVTVDVSSDSVATVDVPLGLKTIAVTTAHALAGVGGNPVAVDVISKSDIETSPVRDSLDRLVETLPGVVQFSYNEPVVDGFHGLTYEIDGAPLPLATTSNFAEIVDPRDIDSLEVYTGAIPAEFGGQRMGAVVNIITNRFADIPQGIFSTVTTGAGNEDQLSEQSNTVARFGKTEAFLNLNTESTNRGLDAPTYTAINDNSSQSDEFLRLVTQFSNRESLAFDYSNQLSQFQVPINTDPNNPNDPIVAVPGTSDNQVEYDRFANLNFTGVSKDGNSIFQAIPWYRSTRIDYNGDLANDVLGYSPNFGCINDTPDCAGLTPPQPYTVNNVGLSQNTNANYIGLRLSEFHAGRIHTWKIGVDADRENATASETFACFYNQCAQPGISTIPIVPVSPYYAATSSQAQAGSNEDAYVQDKWQASRLVVFDYGLRWDHSTGYVSGNMLEPRLGVNISDGGKNIFHAFYGRYYAAPTLEDVRAACVIFQAQGGCQDTNGDTITNPVYDLQPEQDAYYEMGWKHEFDSHLDGWFNIFQKSVVNVLDTTQLLNTPLFAVYNNAIGRDEGVELRLQDRTNSGNSWFLTTTVSGSYAGDISGSTFLFPPGTNPPGIPITSAALLSVEDHDETVVSTAGYTSRFGAAKDWFASLQADYGSGFPVQFQDAAENLAGRLPAHTTFDFSVGRTLLPGKGPDSKGLGVTLDVDNLLNHQYVIKIANGFNTTQIANGRTVLLRVTAPL